MRGSHGPSHHATNHVNQLLCRGCFAIPRPSSLHPTTAVYAVRSNCVQLRGGGYCWTLQHILCPPDARAGLRGRRRPPFAKTPPKFLSNHYTITVGTRALQTNSLFLFRPASKVTAGASTRKKSIRKINAEIQKKQQEQLARGHEDSFLSTFGP